MAPLSTPPLRGRKNPAWNGPTRRGCEQRLWEAMRPQMSPAPPAKMSAHKILSLGEGKRCPACSRMDFLEGKGTSTVEGLRLGLHGELQTRTITKLAGGGESRNSVSSDGTPKTEPKLSGTFGLWLV